MSTGTLDQTFQRALSFHQKGQLETAELLYQAVLDRDHRHFDALLYFGVLRLQQGDAEASAALIREALSQNPHSAEAHANLAHALQALQRYGEAILCYERASVLDPGLAEAHHGHASVLQALGRYDEAARHYQAALAIKPGFAEASYGLAASHHALLLYDEAIKHYETALAIRPGFAEASYGLASAHHELLQHDEAIRHYEATLAIDADFAEASCGLATVLQALARHGEAVVCYQNALAIDPDSVEANRGLAISLHALKRHEAAIAAYRKALGLDPDHAETHNNLGNALHALQRYAEAIACYETTLAIKPDFAAAYYNLGNALLALEQHSAAVASYQKALALAPGLVEAHINCATALQSLNRHDEAIAHCEKTLALDPASAAAHNNYGRILEELGMINEARRAFEKAIDLAPENPGLYVNLFNCKKVGIGDPHLAALELFARDRESLTDDDQIKLDFALAKGYSDIGQHERSFRHLLDGNARKRREIVYDEAAVLRWFDGMRRVFTPAVIREWQDIGDPSSVPVFIVGMIRSGSTLVEQILASHRRVFGAGERKDFANALKTLDADGTGATKVGAGWLLNGENLRALGATYLSGLTSGAPAADKIIDKMPANFRFLGLIRLALPNARIIHTCRDPIDTCLSCFSKLFSDEQPFTYDLGELGRYYRAYRKLMEHWRHVLPPGVMLDVRYEELVTDFEMQTRRIVAHCGLEWHDACLSFYETQRPVKTASVAQVRQPIYRSSVGRWRPDDDLLRPLLEALGAPG